MKTTRPLTLVEVFALESFRNAHGRCWKEALRDCWSTGRYSSADDSATLQVLRNELGPMWLKGYQVKA